MTRNEAAERLRNRLTGDIPWTLVLDAALAEERRLAGADMWMVRQTAREEVIEQIRERLDPIERGYLSKILDDLSTDTDPLTGRPTWDTEA
jgi:hypothetical protein